MDSDRTTENETESNEAVAQLRSELLRACELALNITGRVRSPAAHDATQQLERIRDNALRDAGLTSPPSNDGQICEVSWAWTNADGGVQVFSTGAVLTAPEQAALKAAIDAVDGAEYPDLCDAPQDVYIGPRYEPADHRGLAATTSEIVEAWGPESEAARLLVQNLLQQVDTTPAFSGATDVRSEIAGILTLIEAPDAASETPAPAI